MKLNHNNGTGTQFIVIARFYIKSVAIIAQIVLVQKVYIKRPILLKLNPFFKSFVKINLIEQE